MTLLTQKTVSAGQREQTVGLKQLTNRMDGGGKHMYVIEDLDTGDRLEDPYTNKREARRAFRQVVEDIERGMQVRNGDMALGQTDDILPDNDGLL